MVPNVFLKEALSKTHFRYPLTVWPFKILKGGNRNTESRLSVAWRTLYWAPLAKRDVIKRWTITKKPVNLSSRFSGISLPCFHSKDPSMCIDIWIYIYICICICVCGLSLLGRCPQKLHLRLSFLEYAAHGQDRAKPRAQKLEPPRNKKVYLQLQMLKCPWP